MKCHQCTKPAIFIVGDGESKIPLCLDCKIKFDNMLARQNDMYERQLNYLTDQMESIVGIRGISPKFPERKYITVGDVTLNNINIKNSNIGILNTGTIGSIDECVTSLKRSGEEVSATIIKMLAESIISNKDASDDIKNQTLEILSVLSSEAASPKENRKKAIIKPLLVEMATLLGGVASLGQLWQQIEPVIKKIFGL